MSQFYTIDVHMDGEQFVAGFIDLSGVTVISRATSGLMFTLSSGVSTTFPMSNEDVDRHIDWLDNVLDTSKIGHRK